MNDRKEKQEAGALRLMEALSAVEEELLERCEEETGEKKIADQKQRGKIYRFMVHNRGILAACLCVALLAAGFRAAGLWMADEKSGGSVRRDDTAAPNYACGIAAEPAEEDTEEEQLLQNAVSVKEEENSVNGPDGFMDNCEEAADKKFWDSEGSRSETEKDMAPVITERAERLEDYLTGYLPEGYVPDREAVYVEASADAYVWNWRDGEHTLCLKLWQRYSLTETEDQSSMEVNGIALYSVDGDWKEVFWKPDEESRVQFGLVDKDGIVLEYCGYLGKEEVIELFSGWLDSE